MFALAIWDRHRGRLVLARDRMGQKPLFYAATPGGGLVFGSEPKALLAHPGIARRLDPGGAGALPLLRVHSRRPTRSGRGCSKLPAGARPGLGRRRDRRSRATGNRRRRRPRPTPPLRGGGRAVLGRASARRWRGTGGADVPLGVFLSGGIDSSSVAAALAELEPAPDVRTFSIGFEDPSFDESRHARAVARHLGTDHHERTFSAATVYELLPEVAGWLDEPFGDASILPTHLLSRFARSEVTVVLGGDGADELLAGYPTFAAERAAGVFRRLPRPARALAGAAVGRLPVDHGNISFDFKLKQFLRGAGEPPALAHQRWLGSFSGPEIARLLVDRRRHRRRGRAPGPRRRARAGGRPVDAVAGSVSGYVPARGHPDQGRPGQHGLRPGGPGPVPRRRRWSTRSQRFPPAYKYGRGQTKRMLKRAAADRLPASILARPKKGFGIPVARWLRGPLAPLLERAPGPRAARTAGIVPARRGRPPDPRAPGRDPRPPQAALDPLDVPALVRPLARRSRRKG